MAYNSGTRLPGERASRIGHLEVLKSELVQKIINSFEDNDNRIDIKNIAWEVIPKGKPLPIIFSVDGSYQQIAQNQPPFKRLAFVKTALLRLDRDALNKIDKDSPHPFALRDILAESALYHSTVFPLKNINIDGVKTYHAIRRVIFDSIKDDSLKNEIMATLKWICFWKWKSSPKAELEKFECPHCHKNEATLPFDLEIGSCPSCGNQLFITDMLGFHQEMTEESATFSIASNYMMIHETLLLFTGIRHFWENNRKVLNECLFIKDGPLSIRAQYSKLVEPIRSFIDHASKEGVSINILGQEKSGQFVDYFELINSISPEASLFIPNSNFIKEEIQNRPLLGAPYGKDTNYGAKLFLKWDNHHKMVLNIPFGKYNESPLSSDLIGIDRILGTIPFILSNRFEGALLPIELANGIASLSTYPSAQILKLFSNC